MGYVKNHKLFVGYLIVWENGHGYRDSNYSRNQWFSLYGLRRVNNEDLMQYDALAVRVKEVFNWDIMKRRRPVIRTFHDMDSCQYFCHPDDVKRMIHTMVRVKRWMA